MTDKNNKDFVPEPLIPAGGNSGIFPVHYANKNEVPIYYSKKVRIFGVILAILIILGFVAIYIGMMG